MLWTRPDQAACFFSPSVNETPRITSASVLSVLILRVEALQLDSGV